MISPEKPQTPLDEPSATESLEWKASDLDFVETETLLASEQGTADLSSEGSSSDEPVSDGPNDDDSGKSDDPPSEFIESDRIESLIESLLFVSDRPTSLGSIKQMFKGTNVRTSDITRALDRIASDYASSTRGISLEEIQGGYQIRTKIDNADFLRRLAKARPFRLSGPALEALSIVAYKQPVVKSELDQIRGVESGHLLRALMERNLISFAGKSDLPGKPMQYGTTRKFLEIFGLRNLKELPTLAEIEDLMPEGIDIVEEKPHLSDITSSLSQEVGSSYSEGEDELLKISEQLQGIDVSSEFFEQEKIRQREARDRERAQDIREAATVGEAVEEKDRRWLERYEAGLAAAATQATAAAEAADETADAIIKAAADQAESSPAAGRDFEAIFEDDDKIQARFDAEESEREADAKAQEEASLDAEDEAKDDLGL